MAEKKTRLSASDIGSVRPDSNTAGTEVLKAINHLRDNILLYLAGAAFLVFCIVAGILFRVAALNAEKAVMTEYVAAMSEEDPAVRAAELESVTRLGGRWGSEALYSMGEALIQAGEYDRARDAFQELLDNHPRAEFAPNAADGLGWLAENRGDYEAALAAYARVASDYPESFLARLQDLNQARVFEKQERWEEAKAAYEAQIAAFPDSNAATRAQEALDRLRTSHPELFPEPDPVGEPAEEAEEADADDGVAETPPADADEAEAAEEVEASAGVDEAESLEPAVDAAVEAVEEAVEEIAESEENADESAEESAEDAGESVDPATEIVDDGTEDAGKAAGGGDSGEGTETEQDQTEE